MRPSFTISLLILLSLLLSEQAQGIRLGKVVFMSSLGQHESTIHHEKEIASSKTSKNTDDVINVAGEAILCKDGDCSGNSRKLFSVTLPSTTTTTTSKNDEKINGKNDKVISNGDQIKTTHNNKRHGDEEKKYSSSVNSLSTTSDEHQAENEPYPDVVDLAEMDYSPARRKTPIHN